MKPTNYIISLILVFLAACTSNNKELNAIESVEVPAQTELTTAEALLDSANSEMAAWQIEGKYFGAFYDDAVHFFTKEEPGYSVFNAPVVNLSEMVLEGDLTKKKYVLEYDITDQILSYIKSTKLAPIDQSSIDLVKAGSVWESKQDRRLNQNLTQFELRWRDNYYQYIYSVNKNTTYQPFTLHVIAHYNG